MNFFKINILSLFLLALLLVSCWNSSSKTENKEEIQSTKEATKDTMSNPQKADTLASGLVFDPALLPEEPIFEINTTKGTLVIVLYNDTPLHKENFIKLASEGYYDNMLFHRVIRGFMIQTGDPFTKDPSNKDKFGTGGPDYEIPAEILDKYTHKKGAIAAARRSDLANPKRKSSGSQFYIVENAEYSSHLDGDYTIFGETIDGFDVIDKIARVRTKNERPVEDIRILSIKPII